jgi:hypothetical protein
MNKRPIETAHDADLRLSLQAIRRAAQRARELAAQTGTDIVISRGGVIEHISPWPEPELTQVQKPPAPDGDNQ